MAARRLIVQLVVMMTAAAPPSSGGLLSRSRECASVQRWRVACWRSGQLARLCCVVAAWPARGRLSRKQRRMGCRSQRSPQWRPHSHTHCTERQRPRRTRAAVWRLLSLLLPLSSSAVVCCESAWPLACGAERRSQPPHTVASHTPHTRGSPHWSHTERRGRQW